MPQGPPSGPENPGEHLQVFTFTLPAGFVEPKGHARHVSIDIAARVLEYVPPPHSVQFSAPFTDLNVPG